MLLARALSAGVMEVCLQNRRSEGRGPAGHQNSYVESARTDHSEAICFSELMVLALESLETQKYGACDAVLWAQH